MRLGKFLITVLFIGFSATAHAINPGSALQIDDMPVACTALRAEKDQNAACHCPPVSLCGEMPDIMKSRCGCVTGSADMCPASYPNGPTALAECPNGQKRDINGRCCDESQKKYVRFNSWEVRWREQRDYALVYIIKPNIWYFMPFPFMRNNNLDMNWNRQWLPSHVKNGMWEYNGSNYNEWFYKPVDVETGQRVSLGCSWFGSSDSNFICGNAAAKICPTDKQYSGTYQMYRSSLNGEFSTAYVYGSSTQFCSIKRKDGKAVSLNADGVVEGYWISDPENYLITQCCVYEVPSEASCLAPDTPVLMADGTEKPIQQVVKGDVVKGQTRDNTVLGTTILTLDNRDMYSLNDGALKLTAEHPIMTKDGWKSVNGDTVEALTKYGLDKVGKLKVGDEIITAKGNIKLEKMEKLPLAKDTTTFNLKLDGDETFHAGGIVVKDN